VCGCSCCGIRRLRGMRGESLPIGGGAGGSTVTMDGQGLERAPRAAGRRGGWSARALLTMLLGASVVTMLLAGCGSNGSQTLAAQNKLKLDHELTHAKTDL